MSVDMFEYRFKKELMDLDEFHPNDTRDPRAWPSKGSRKGEFPAWRALFTALCLHGHSTGYRLFSYEKFFNLCKRAYSEEHPEKERFGQYFQGDLLDGMRQRIGVWYESGMAETYLYACLVEALEDKAKAGMVLYDPRVDWKLKSDLIVHMNGQAMRINAYFGPSEGRQQIEQKREEIERERKQNTPESAHWNNRALEGMKTFQIQVTKEEKQVFNGFRLFSKNAVNTLLGELYTHAGIAPRDRKLM